METKLCPKCGANVEGLIERCDCCGASLQPNLKSFLFFSTESKGSVATQIIRILNPVETYFTQKYRGRKFSENLDDIAIIPVCIPEDMIQDGCLKERRYVSLKKRYADIRLHISYDAFIKGDQSARIGLCAKNIAEAVSYIKKKDKTFDAEQFLNAIQESFEDCHGKALKGLLERYFN